MEPDDRLIVQGPLCKCGSKSWYMEIVHHEPGDGPNPPFDIHLECTRCHHETLYEGCYMVSHETSYDPDVVVVEDLTPAPGGTLGDLP